MIKLFGLPAVFSLIGHTLLIELKKGLLKSGMTLIEATSGNTGAALAMIGAQKNHRVIVTAPAKTSMQKIRLMPSYGAEVIVSPADAPLNYVQLAKSLHKTMLNSFFLDQYNNPMNVSAHYHTTGPEIWKQMEGDIDYLVACGSSGGTITGVGQFLKQQNPKIKIMMPDVMGSVYYRYFKIKTYAPEDSKPYRLEGVGKDFICNGLDFSILEDVIQLTDEEAFAAVKELLRREGILAGGSSDAALRVAEVLASRIEGKANRVIIFPDSGLKYR